MNLVLLRCYSSPHWPARPNQRWYFCDRLQSLEEKKNWTEGQYDKTIRVTDLPFAQQTVSTGWRSIYVSFYFDLPEWSSFFPLLSLYTSKVTSYYLLLCLTAANEIPSALIKQVGNLLPNEEVVSLFSHRQTKTKQQREAVHKGALVRWVTCCPLSLRSIKTIQQEL